MGQTYHIKIGWRRVNLRKKDRQDKPTVTQLVVALYLSVLRVRVTCPMLEKARENGSLNRDGLAPISAKSDALKRYLVEQA